MKDPNLWIKIQMISAVVGDMKSWIGIAALVLAATANAKRLERGAGLAGAARGTKTRSRCGGPLPVCQDQRRRGNPAARRCLD